MEEGGGISLPIKGEDLKQEEAEQARVAQRDAVFSTFASIASSKKKDLKPTTTVVKRMFTDAEGRVVSSYSSNAKSDTDESKDIRIPLSKLVEYDTPYATIAAALADTDGVNAGGVDMYGLSALHKFASWNRVEAIALLLELGLGKGFVEKKCGAGKTALTWAVEMGADEAAATLRAAEG
jgi:ankyrin repeat protein